MMAVASPASPRATATTGVPAMLYLSHLRRKLVVVGFLATTIEVVPRHGDRLAVSA